MFVLVLVLAHDLAVLQSKNKGVRLLRILMSMIMLMLLMLMPLLITRLFADGGMVAIIALSLSLSLPPSLLRSFSDHDEDADVRSAVLRKGCASMVKYGLSNVADFRSHQEHILRTYSFQLHHLKLARKRRCSLSHSQRKCTWSTQGDALRALAACEGSLWVLAKSKQRQFASQHNGCG